MPVIIETGAGATPGQMPLIVDGGDKTDDLPLLVVDNTVGPNMSLPMMLPQDPTQIIMPEEQQYDQQQVCNIFLDQESKIGGIDTAAVVAQDNTIDATAKKDNTDAI